MKLLATKLREHIDKNNLSIADIVRKVNKLQEAISPGKIPMGRNAMYFYMNGHTPPQERLYILAAVLKIHPKKLFKVVCDDNRFDDYVNRLKVFNI